MNIWLKRVSFVLPPVIVAGVYFNKIPVGPSIRKKIDSLMTEEKLPPKKVYPLVEKVRGEVYVKDHASFPPVLLKGGELLKEGQSLATGPHGALLLSYRGPDTWFIRISPDTQVNVDELLKMKKEQSTTINLLHGGLIVRMNNVTGSARAIEVRTKFASFTARSGRFAVLTDGETRTLMTVQQGMAEAENFKLMERSSVRGGYTYFINREGEKKIQLDLDALDLYNWEPTDIDGIIPSPGKVIGVIGDLGPTPDDQEKAKLEVLKEIDASILEFKNENEKLRREYNILNDNAEQSRIGFRAERAKVNKDIHCLETSTFECNLFSEKILLLRGFPRTWGNPQYRNSLVVGLGKYLQERNEEVAGREEEAKILADLMAKREAALKAVEADRAREKNLDKLMLILQADLLRR
jgi:hypothetical protein